MDISALISEAHLNKVMGYVEAAKQAGAHLLCGGERVTDDDLAKDNFVAPAVFVALGNIGAPYE